MNIQAFFDKPTSTLTYLVWDEQTKDSVIIDPILNYDATNSTFKFQSIEDLCKRVLEKGLQIHFIMETHAHADHLSGAQELKKRFPKAEVVIGEHITKVQRIFADIYNLGEDFATDGSQFDRLLSEGDRLVAGSLKIDVLHTPGHTPACCSYVIGDAVFVGDALFMPDYGAARCDFPGGSSRQLYHSVKDKLYRLPEHTRLFTAHDYQPGGRELRFEATVGESKKYNVQISQTTPLESFVTFRNQRDGQLGSPKLLFQSLQVNIDGGRLPKPENNGVRYLKIPLKPSGEV